MHNALMGCMKCQDRCPANAKPLASTIRLDDVAEEETKMILDGKPDDALFKSMAKKLKGFGSSKEYFPTFTRNLKALLRG
jgi:epoxyqueuosine reductase